MNKLLLSRVIFNFKVLIAILFFSFVTIVSFISVFTYLAYAKDLISKETIMNKNNTGIVLLDRNNKPFFTFYSAQQKEFIPLNKIPVDVRNAVIAVEDKEFYKHKGFSIKSIIRSVFLDIKARGASYGGSTITQQLVKNVLLSSKRSILRKYQEIILAQEIERRYTKAEILEMYLNSVYFGEGSFGIQQAAKKYFGKNASDLSLAEATLLAGLLPAPSQYSPLSGNGEKALERQKFVLNEMVRQGYINDDQRRSALNTQLVYLKLKDDINSVGAHFALMVRDELLKKYGEEQISRSGFRVKTTLDLDWQKFAETTLYKQIDNLSSSNVTNGAAVVIDPKTGEVRVLVGSKDWYDSKYGKMNMANTPRSSGSAFKPIIYATALEERLITAATALHDQPTTFPGNYKPQDYDRKWRGIVLTRRALANSLNVPSVEVMQKIGVPAGLEMAKRLGITSLKDASNYGLSLVLGTGEVKLLELTNAYAVFANNGVKNNISLITSITDKQEHVIYNNKSSAKRVIEPAVAFIISSILSDAHTRAEVFGNVLDTSLNAAVKTGTGEDYKSALTIGYTPNLTVGVWLGNNDNAPMSTIAGSIGPAPVWRTLIEKFAEGLPTEPFNKPSSVIATGICSYNGLIASRGFSSTAFNEYFITGTQPTQLCVIPRPTVEPIFGTEPFKIKRHGKNKEEAQNITELQQQVKEQVQQKLQQIQQQAQQQIPYISPQIQ